MGKKISLPVMGADEAKAAAGPRTRSEGGTVLEEIGREVGENRVLIYMKGVPAQPMCGFSARAVSILDELGQPYHAVDILPDPEKRQAIKEYSDWQTIPQVYVNGEFLGGSDILIEIHESGELRTLVEQVAGKA